MSARIISIRKGMDAHCHFRTGEMLKSVVGFTARSFEYAVAMGNTTPAVKTAGDTETYGQEILSAVPSGVKFSPVMTIMLTKSTFPRTVRKAAELGFVALKYIPEGVSTNSEESVPFEQLHLFYSVLEAAQECNMPFVVHWELLSDGKGKKLPEIARELWAIRYLDKIAKLFPKLRITAEHASTRQMIQYVKQAPLNVRATLTIHHATITYDDVCDGNGGIYNPHNYCKPIAKRPADRAAVVEAMISGDPHFFFGSDSAPHLISAKEKIPPAAGIFSAPVIDSLLLELFMANNALNRLDNFRAGFGPEFYGLPRCTETIELIEEDWTVPREFNGIVPFMAGKTLHYKVAE